MFFWLKIVVLYWTTSCTAFCLCILLALSMKLYEWVHFIFRFSKNNDSFFIDWKQKRLNKKKTERKEVNVIAETNVDKIIRSMQRISTEKSVRERVCVYYESNGMLYTYYEFGCFISPLLFLRLCLFLYAYLLLFRTDKQIRQQSSFVCFFLVCGVLVCVCKRCAILQK